MIVLKFFFDFQYLTGFAYYFVISKLENITIYFLHCVGFLCVITAMNLVSLVGVLVPFRSFASFQYSFDSIQFFLTLVIAVKGYIILIIKLFLFSYQSKPI